MVGRIPVAALTNPPVLVDVFAETILEELDFRVEAANMLDIARVMVELDQRHWVVARPHPELVTRRMLVMERPSGFAFDDVIGMKAAGVDTEAVSSAPPPTTCAPSSPLCATSVPSTPTSISTGSSRTSTWTAPPPPDLTKMSGEQMVAELQQTVKQLLAHGARLPKVLMLFVKDMLFIDGAILHLAPDIDLMAEVATIAGTITERRRDLQQRREVIREKMEEQRRSGSIREMRRSLRRRG